MAALEQFMRATARVPVAPDAAAAPVPGSAWQQAALAEGVQREPAPPLPWL